MRAVVYKESFKVAIENTPDPTIKHPNDAIVKITSSCICGSDLHMYEGRTAAAPGIVLLQARRAGPRLPTRHGPTWEDRGARRCIALSTGVRRRPPPSTPRCYIAVVRAGVCPGG